jgi:ATP-dependent Clp protease ATP-binding subunit ClpB
VDFKNTVIIMTSNIGSHLIVNLGGDHDDQIEKDVMDELRANFRPEFLNRVDETIIFRRLSREQIGEIVQIQLDSVSGRLAERNISLHITPAARDLLATLGYEPAYGARPLKRVIQKQILDPLARKLLGGEIHDGETVTIDATEKGFTFTGTFTNARTAA